MLHLLLQGPGCSMNGRGIRLPRVVGRVLAALAAVVFSLAAAALPATAASRPPDLILDGEVRRSDHQTFRELPFRVPAGVDRLRVELSHDGAATKTVLDLGVRDPERLRGWSGGARTGFEIGDSGATPGYLPGPLPPGRWKILLGVPNVRPDAKARYSVRIWFGRPGSAPDPAFSPSVREGADWYRGDLHLHTAHSDGRCASVTGRPGPCPAFLTFQAARAARLDFIALSEHNTTSQAAAVGELSAYFDDLLVIPAREVTTFEGHANIYGTWAPLDFRIGRGDVAALGALLDKAEAAGALVAPNHPGLPSGEVCMGCGWTAATDWSRIPALEVVSGGVPALGMDGAFSGLALWDRLLGQGLRVTGIAGSDTHDPLRTDPASPRIGRPATVVFAERLSVPAILAGVRAGRVFLDLTASPDSRLDYVASTPDGRSAAMGGELALGANRSLDLRVTVAGAGEGARVRLVGDLGPVDLPVPASGQVEVRGLSARDGAAWFRLEVVGPNGSRRLIGNPIYLRANPDGS
ncbi:MAG: hypothetical protein RL588_573 [Pseudomonadota bacterium]|jgi:hypothetical protein